MDSLPEVFAQLKMGQLPSTDLLILVATRLVGYIMTFSACFVKLPQIMKIYKNQSAKGLSITSAEMEVVICLIHVAYCYLTNMRFSSYGEAVASLVQNSVILLQIYHHSQAYIKRRLAVVTSFVAFVLAVSSGRLSVAMITSAFLFNQAFFVTGRSIQIVKTTMEKDASQLSVSTYATVMLGKGIRLVTSIIEGASLAMYIANLVGFLMNAISVVQILYYNRKKQQKSKDD